jgi:hypothetical protein
MIKATAIQVRPYASASGTSVLQSHAELLTTLTASPPVIHLNRKSGYTANVWVSLCTVTISHLDLSFYCHRVTELFLIDELDARPTSPSGGMGVQGQLGLATEKGHETMAAAPTTRTLPTKRSI